MENIQKRKQKDERIFISSLEVLFTLCFGLHSLMDFSINFIFQLYVYKFETRKVLYFIRV